jgi:Predicted membrane protein
MITLGSVITVFAVAAAPIVERGALPLALHGFKLPLALAFPLVVVGNSLPAIAVIYLLDPVLTWLGKYIPPIHRFATIVLAHFRRKVHPWVDRYGTLGLTIVVAIPTPLTGSWTGSGGAAILGMHKRNAIFGIIVGVIIANLIILAVDAGVTKIFF